MAISFGIISWVIALLTVATALFFNWDKKNKWYIWVGIVSLVILTLTLTLVIKAP